MQLVNRYLHKLDATDKRIVEGKYKTSSSHPHQHREQELNLLRKNMKFYKQHCELRIEDNHEALSNYRRNREVWDDLQRYALYQAAFNCDFIFNRSPDQLAGMMTTLARDFETYKLKSNEDFIIDDTDVATGEISTIKVHVQLDGEEHPVMLPVRINRVIGFAYYEDLNTFGVKVGLDASSAEMISQNAIW